MFSYITEDGVELKTGDDAYDYYSMKPGKIGRDSGGGSGWFEFNHFDGTTVLLNGQRICSVEFARERGFKDA
jgi:hypothetical protein